MAKETYYFKHDYNARNDFKISALISDHGAAGYGIYWCLVEMLHEESEHKLPLEEYFYRVLAKLTSTSVDDVSSIVHDCLNIYHLFTEKEGFFYSERVLRNLEEREDIKKKRSEAGKISAEKRKIAAHVQQSSTRVKQSSTRKGKEIKGKEIKEEENREEENLKASGKPDDSNQDVELPKIIFPFNGPAFPAAWNDWKEYKQEQHKFKYNSLKSEMMALKALCTLAENNEAKAIEIIEYSIGSGYKGLFAPNNYSKSQTPQSAGTDKNPGAKPFNIREEIRRQQERA
ncbi:DUF4373 domain-containing protein [Pontibacter liquoris]|uniref:DUF4373 domain-containing protein n=1 Tax=Pontibacter liquoris TaxID=2905677 RepID=UPI001FA7A5B2|nr:DUF4373 domain-containing protein [Pontibacter liquoris]